MKVLIISEYFPPFGKGGGEISASLLAEHLAISGIKIHVLTAYFPGFKKKEIKNKIIIHRLLKTGKNPSSLLGNLKRILFFKKSLLKELNRLDKKENFDIIHCMNISSITAVKLKRKLKKKFVLHVNSPVLFCPKGTLMYKDKEICNKNCNLATFLDCYLNSSLFGKLKTRFYTKFNPFFIYTIRKRYTNYQKLIRKFDYYMPISNYMKKRLIFSGLNKDKINVIYNINELNKFFNLKTKKHSKLKLLYLGEYSKPKGAHLLLDALKKLNFDYETSYYGEGILKKYLKNEVRKHNLNVKINNKVNYKKIPEILENHDVLVFPSFVGEAFGRAVLEGCAAGKTVIASKIGGIPDIIEHGKNGYLFAPSKTKELAKLLEITNKTLLNPKSVRNTIKKKFSNDKSVKEVIRIYNNLVSPNR